jgi:hypothetical protein
MEITMTTTSRKMLLTAAGMRGTPNQAYAANANAVRVTGIPKLTDRQCVVLAAAAQLDDHAIMLPETLKGRARDTFAQGLLRRGLAEEVPAVAGQPVFRIDVESGMEWALVATSHGLSAIGIGEEAFTVDVGGGESPIRGTGEVTDRTPEIPPSTIPPATVLPAFSTGPMRANTKQARLVAMLSQPGGCAVSEAAAELGWLAQTTRAAMTGLRRKGYTIERVNGADGQGSRHRIVKSASI